jgi:hypothetical protein
MLTVLEVPVPKTIEGALLEKLKDRRIRANPRVELSFQVVAGFSVRALALKLRDTSA